MGTCHHQLSEPWLSSLLAVKPSVTYLGWSMGKSCGFVQGCFWGCWEWQC